MIQEVEPSDESGQPKVLDFGVAHATDGAFLESTGHTRTGQLIGTVGYMSPEQVAGDPRAVDVRSDVYLLGVILYELLAERLPYRFERLPAICSLSSVSNTTMIPVRSDHLFTILVGPDFGNQYFG
jgi:serine/threonine protein kinase